jgi:AhpD family alkylhydroperoxidase
MKKRLALQTFLPDAYKLMKEMDGMIKDGINPLYLEMIKTRASQINGCAYCLNMHITDAVKLGEDPQRMHVLSAWREAKHWFTEEEQIILQLTEEITLIGQHGISEAVYDRAEEIFGEEKLAHIILAAISINSWNRVGVGLHLHPVKYKSER